MIVALEKCKKLALKDFIEKSILLNFNNLSAIFCPRLSEETHFYFQFKLDTFEIAFTADFNILKTSFAVKYDI